MIVKNYHDSFLSDNVHDQVDTHNSRETPNCWLSRGAVMMDVG